MFLSVKLKSFEAIVGSISGSVAAVVTFIGKLNWASFFTLSWLSMDWIFSIDYLAAVFWLLKLVATTFIGGYFGAWGGRFLKLQFQKKRENGSKP